MHRLNAVFPLEQTKVPAASRAFRVIPLNQPAFDALVTWAGRLVESKAEDYVFPECEAAGIERRHPDRERIDPSRPIKSWRSAWRAALKPAGLPLRFHDLRHVHYQAGGVAGERTDPNGYLRPRQPQDDRALLIHTYGGKACGP
jgi:integrase